MSRRRTAQGVCQAAKSGRPQLGQPGRDRLDEFDPCAEHRSWVISKRTLPGRLTVVPPFVFKDPRRLDCRDQGMGEPVRNAAPACLDGPQCCLWLFHWRVPSSESSDMASRCRSSASGLAFYIPPGTASHASTSASGSRLSRYHRRWASWRTSTSPVSRSTWDAWRLSGWVRGAPLDQIAAWPLTGPQQVEDLPAGRFCQYLECLCHVGNSLHGMLAVKVDHIPLRTSPGEEQKLGGQVGPAGVCRSPGKWGAGNSGPSAPLGRLRGRGWSPTVGIPSTATSRSLAGLGADSDDVLAELLRFGHQRIESRCRRSSI